MTGRLPFEPSRAKASAKAQTKQGERAEGGGTITVSELAAKIDSSIKKGMPDRVSVRGEVSGTSRRTHLYLTLKDDGALIGSVVFRSALSKLSYVPKDGESVVAHGRLEFYGPAGRVSLIVDRFERVGLGQLEAQLRARVDAFRERGWFDDSNKKAVPLLPTRVAIVTSKTGAALQDVIDTARRRLPGVELIVADARVQGDGAAQEIAGRIKEIDRQHRDLGIHALLVTRGGGSIEDLWAFNEEEVAHAIRECSIPVVAAIGHETDTTIAELVADLRCATPTQAAVAMIPDRAAMVHQIENAAVRMRAALRSHVQQQQASIAHADADLSRSARGRLEEARNRVGRSIHRLGVSSRLSTRSRFAERVEALVWRLRRGIGVETFVSRCDHAEARLKQAMTASINHANQQLQVSHRKLELVGPQRVLARGFSITVDADRRVVRDASSLVPGDQIETRVAVGRFEAVVAGGSAERRPEKIEPGSDVKLSKRSAQTRKGTRDRTGRTQPNADDRPQLDLF